MAKARKILFIFLTITAAALLLGMDQSMGAEDIVVAVDKSTLVKWLGMIALAILVEIWRGQRSLYKITTSQGQALNKLKGFCEGKNGNCGTSDEEDSQ